MKISLHLVLCLFLFTACNKDDCASKQETTVKAEGTVTQAECESPIEDEDIPTAEDGDTDQTPPPTEADTFGVNVQMHDFTASGETKINKALDIIKTVVASQEFKDRILNYTYKSKKTFVDNNGLTNAQIYEKILQGKEDLVPSVDNEMDLELQYYYSGWTSTIGYTYPDELTIYMNGKFFNSYTAYEVAGNIFHEWLHKIGFDHDDSYSESRDHSVPYAIGYLMEEMGEKLD